MQKGYQLKGVAKIISENDPDFSAYKNELLKITKGKFPFKSITKISVKTAKEIIAPRYILYPETTEQQQVESARKMYNL